MQRLGASVPYLRSDLTVLCFLPHTCSHLQVLFQNLFPSINVHKTRLSACQRVVLLSHNKETGEGV